MLAGDRCPAGAEWQDALASCLPCSVGPRPCRARPSSGVPWSHLYKLAARFRHPHQLRESAPSLEVQSDVTQPSDSRARGCPPAASLWVTVSTEACPLCPIIPALLTPRRTGTYNGPRAWQRADTPRGSLLSVHGVSPAPVYPVHVPAGH